MKVLHICSLPGGGAFRAMYRLHKGLLAAGEDSLCLCQENRGCSDVIVGRSQLGSKLFPRLDRLPFKFFPKRDAEQEFNLEWVPGGILSAIRKHKPDIVHLHWVGRSFMRIEDIQYIKNPIVWTMHDSWTFTGGCHVPYDCTRYRENCGSCPQLGSALSIDLSRWVWRRKAIAWGDVPMNLISPSRWLAECASSSPLLKGKSIGVIPNGLDLQKFSPLERQLAKQALGLDPNKKFILFGATYALNHNKGFQFIKPAVDAALTNLSLDAPELLIVGQDTLPHTADLAIPVHLMGTLHDEITLRLLFNAADITLVPSLQESFGQMAAESLSCGTPVVAFNTTGLKDIVDHMINGYLASPYDPEDLGVGITYILNHPEPQSLRDAARAKAVQEYSINTMTSRYKDLYNKLLESKRR